VKFSFVIEPKNMPTPTYPTDAHVGRKIRELRRRRGLSQQTVGEAVGISFQQLQKYETGANRINASRLFIVALALDEGVEWFFEGLPRTLKEPPSIAPSATAESTIAA
jgi:transcriptional regulator with XRE-family HTH domain